MRLNLAGAEVLAMLLGYTESVVAGMWESEGSGDSDSCGKPPVKRTRMVMRPRKAQDAVKTPENRDAGRSAAAPGSSTAGSEPGVPGGSGGARSRKKLSAEERVEAMKDELEILVEDYKKMTGRKNVDKAMLVKKIGEVSASLRVFLQSTSNCTLLRNVLRANEILVEAGEGLEKEEMEHVMRLPIGALSAWLVCNKHQKAIYRELEILSKTYSEDEINEMMGWQSVMCNRLDSRFSKLRVWEGLLDGHERIRELVDLSRVERDIKSVMRLQRLRISIMDTNKYFKNGRKKAKPGVNYRRKLYRFLESLKSPGVSRNWVINTCILKRTIKEVGKLLDTCGKRRTGQKYALSRKGTAGSRGTAAAHDADADSDASSSADDIRPIMESQA